MEITVAGQTWMFLLSIALGALLGACYDVFRILRIAVPHRAGVVLAEDILFSVICAAATFLFLVSVDSGRIRVFALIGELVGFALYYCTVGALVIGISKWIIHAVRWLFALLWRIFAAPVLRFIKFCCGFFSGIAKNLANYIKIRAKNSNIYLKKCKHILYNQKKRLLRERRKKTLGDRNG